MEGGPQFERVYAQHNGGFGEPSTSFHALTDPYGGAEAILKAPVRAMDSNSNFDQPGGQAMNHHIMTYGGSTAQPMLVNHVAGVSQPPMITSLAATSDAKHLIPRVLGTAIHQSLAKYGRVPESSTDLSKFSAPFVSKLTGRQFERRNDEGENYADITAAELHAEHQMATRRMPDDDRNPQPVDEAVQNSGAKLFRNHVKYMARMRKQGIESQHVQPELPFSA